MLQSPHTRYLVVADDNPLFRQALTALLNQTSDLRVIAEVESEVQLQVVLRSIVPDLVLLQVHLSGGHFGMGCIDTLLPSG